MYLENGQGKKSQYSTLLKKINLSCRMLMLLIISYLYKVRLETCWILFKSSLWNYPKSLDLFRISYKKNEVKKFYEKKLPAI